MADIHPTETAGTGRLRPRRTTYKPGDQRQELLPCAQCGLPFRVGKDSEGDSQESPGISMGTTTVTVDNDLDKLPQSLKPADTSGTFTEITITVVVTGFIFINGLDNNVGGPIFIVRDTSGNEYSLKNGVGLVGPASFHVDFRANDMGSINPAVGTVTIIVTPVAGVTSVTNAVEASTVGTLVYSPSSLEDFYGSSVEVSDPTVVSGCRFCGTLNPRAVGRNKDFDVGFKNLENK